MQISQVLIRCDASLVIGSGHVMRCRTLARQLLRVGVNVIFLCRRQPGDLIDLLSQEFCVLILPQQPLIVSNYSIGRKTHQAILGCSQQDDADQCADLISDSAVESIDWIVVDHYGIDAIWENRLLQRIRISSTPKILVIDDLADRPHQADLLLDQNFVDQSVKSRYANLVPNHCRVFEGPHYALLGSEYSQLHNTISKRTELKRVLVSFGGVDAQNLTASALEALMLPEFSHIKVDIVLGHKAPHRNTVAELVLRRPFTTLHDPMPTLSDLMVRADLAIGACGSTTWERACLGLPSIIVVTASNQLRSAQLLHKVGYLSFLGNASEVRIAHFVNALRQRLDTPWPIDQSYNLTDGYGASRLVMAMLRINSPITLRLVEPSDEALFAVLV